MTDLRELRDSRDLFVNLTLRELRSRYKRSMLGWLWSLLNPLATMMIFSVVFRFFLKVPVPTGDPSGLQIFAFFLLCALLPYNLLANALNGGMGALVGNSNLVTKVWFPRELLVAANTTSGAIGTLIEFGVLAVALMFAGNFVLPWLIPAFVILLIQVVFALGLALLVAVLFVYFRDMEHLVGIGLQVWFYATPIIYPMSLVDSAFESRPWLLDLYRLNPLLHFSEAYRNVLYDLRFPSAGTMIFIVVSALISLLVGSFVFSRFSGRLAEEL